MIGDARQDFAKILLRIEAVQLRSSDQAVDDRGALTACIGTREEIILPAQSDGTDVRFGGMQEQDVPASGLTGLYPTPARNYASNPGRWTTPDPLGGDLTNPQSLNRYTYARDNPLSLTDATGLDFYMSCARTEKNASSCQQETVGYDKSGNAEKAWVEGVTQSGTFVATLIGNDSSGNLVDKTTGTGVYTGSVSGSGVFFSQNGGKTSSMGVRGCGYSRCIREPP